MGTTGVPQAPPIHHVPLEFSPSHGVPRRHVLKALAVGGATAVVAGTGALGYRVFDTAVLDPGWRAGL